MTTVSAITTSSLAASARYKAFAVVFSTTFPLLYVLAEIFNVPLFTFHPATNRFEFGWAPARSGEGPTMYWYGWTALCLIAGSVLGLLGTMLPDSIIKKAPLFPVWLLPILGFIPLTIGLMSFWTK
jgi:hypothetical protein